MSGEVPQSEDKQLAVIGGGISGLAAAHRLSKLVPGARLHLIESSSRLGGVLQTESREGFLIEHSADMFTTLQPWAVDLCREIGFESELIQPSEENRRAFVVKHGRLRPVPDGLSLLGPSRIWPLVTTRLLGIGGKLRMLREMFVPTKRDTEDESLADFTRRRLGQQAFDWLIQPLVGGIYTADPEKLSMQATMPQFLEMERTHGSLFRGMRKNQKQKKTNQAASGARYGTFRAPRQGMVALIEALAAELPTDSIHLNCAIDTISPLPQREGWRLQIRDGQSWEVDGVVLATPAASTARLVEPIHEPLAIGLRRIPMAGVAIAILGVRREQIGRPLDGFGFVVPMRAERKILAGSFASLKFAGRAADDQILMRVFVGGACQPELLEQPDDEILALVWSELRELIQIRGTPIVQQLVRWQNIMPQYHVGHVQLVDELEEHCRQIPRLELAGNAYRGVGIPFCVRSGEEAAQRMAKAISD